MFPVKTQVLINFSNPCFARGQALFQTTIHVPPPSSFEDRIANKTESQLPKVKAQPTFYSAWGIYGTLEGCNFIFRAQLSKWQVLHPWQNCPGTHITADLQLYLSFVHYFPKQKEFHGQWIMEPSLSKEQNMMVATLLKKRQGQDKCESWIHASAFNPDPSYPGECSRATCWAWHVFISLTEDSSHQSDGNVWFSPVLCKPARTSPPSLPSVPWGISHSAPTLPPSLFGCRNTAPLPLQPSSAPAARRSVRSAPVEPSAGVPRVVAAPCPWRIRGKAGEESLDK